MEELSGIGGRSRKEARSGGSGGLGATSRVETGIETFLLTKA